MQMIGRKCIYDSSLPYVRYKNLPNINLTVTLCHFIRKHTIPPSLPSKTFPNFSLQEIPTPNNLPHT